MKNIDLSKKILAHSLELTAEQADTAAKAIASYNKFCQTVPSEYIWDFNSDISISEKLKNETSIPEINSTIWKDRFHSTRACQIIFLNRSNALFQNLKKNIEEEDYLCSAIIARALLELCMWHAYYSYFIEYNINNIMEDPNSLLINHSELESMLAKILFGSNTTSEKELKQQKVMTVLKDTAITIGKNYPLEETYDVLCEYTHPNIGGNNLFVDFDINAGMKPVEEMEIRIRENQMLKQSDKLEAALYNSIIFCCTATIHSSRKYQDAAATILKKFVQRQRPN